MTEEEMIKWAMNEDWDMMNYQKSMVQRDDAVAKAMEFLHKEDYDMFKFWGKAAREFEKRATEQLTVTLKRKKRAVLGQVAVRMYTPGRLPLSVMKEVV